MAEGLSSRGAAPAVMAFGDDGVESVTYAELADTTARLARGLLRTGLRRDEPVLLCAPNSPAWIIAYFAIVRAGGLAVPLDDLSTARDLSRVLADGGIRRIFTSRSHLAAIGSRGEEATLDIVLLDGHGGEDGVAGWRDLLAEGEGPLPRVGADAVASLLYTSGTTGPPKAVPLTHENFLANVRALLAERLAGPQDKVLLPLPLHHSYPFTIGLLTTLACGATLVLPAGISGPQLAGALKDSGATIMIGVPRLYLGLLSAIEIKADKLGLAGRSAFRSLLRLSIFLRRKVGLRLGRIAFRRLHGELGPNLRMLVSGGARLDPDVAWKLEGLGWEVLTGYGLTETAPILTFNSRGRTRIDSAGCPLPGVELRIDAEPGREAGEIVARGPNIFQGYRNNPQATEGAFTDDGWFRTGDMGYLDGDGFLHIVGRVKEVIVLPDGKNVIPEDVEDAYASSALIREVAVMEQDGVLAALVVPDDEAIRAQGSAQAQLLLRNEIEDVSLRLPPYQRLVRFRLVREALPRTHLGKLRRHLLPDIYAGAQQARSSPAAAKLSEADRRLLASEPAAEVWAWLARRFPDNTLSLDTSPQLDLEIDSVEWMSMTLEIQDNFRVRLTGEAVARIVTLRDLLVEVMGAERDVGAREPPDSFTLPEQEGDWLRPLAPLAFLFGMAILACNWLWMRCLFRLKVKGADRLPERGAYVITPNHLSLLDPLAVAAAIPFRHLRRTYWAGWTGKMFAGPASRLLSRVTRVFPVDPDRGPASSLMLGRTVLERGETLVWFPEGRRSPTGDIRRFLPGIGTLMQQTDTVAVPTLVRGTFEALPRGRRMPRFYRISISFGSPLGVEQLRATGQGEDEAERIADGLRRAVAALGGEDRTNADSQTTPVTAD